MKLYLFGGAEIPLHQVEPLKTLIKQVIVNLHPASVLHIPFARLNPTEEEWKEGWFKDMMKDTGIEILDARNNNDINKASGSVMFINGGIGRYDLFNAFTNNPKLLTIIKNAEHIVGESAGSMVMGEYQRGARGESRIIKGLGILKNTIIEPHYTERNSQQLLVDGMKKSGMKYGIGIDCATAIVVDPKEFPDKWTKIGNGNIEVNLNYSFPTITTASKEPDASRRMEDAEAPG